METHLRTELVLAALDMAVAQRQGRTSFIILSRTASACCEAGVRPSMGSVGDGYHNACARASFATLESSCSIEGGYNPRRRGGRACHPGLVGRDC